MIPEPGDFYMGGVLERESGERTAEPLILPSHHLTTHGVILGMTGSGKTGLGVVLLEEALLSGIPTLVLDPKGDMGNLLLGFPGLTPSEFQPWVDPAEARREGIGVDELAARTADSWKEGLASWGIGPERIKALREAADFNIYTPGSSAGVPLSLIGSLRAPKLDWEIHRETLRDEIEGFVSGLLEMAGVSADPISDPEHILLSNLIEHAWTRGRDLDLPGLIGMVMNPPIRKLGVFVLDEFFPEKKRSQMAMRLNGLVASNSFSSWVEGRPLDVESLLWSDGGRPTASIMHLAHLSDSERQFVVTLLLSQVITWMRQQPGTSELRALIYMDEMFGFAPPHGRTPLEEAYTHSVQTSPCARSRVGGRDAESCRSGLQDHVQRGHVDDRSTSDRKRQAEGPRRTEVLCRGRRHLDIGPIDRRSRKTSVCLPVRSLSRFETVHIAVGDVIPSRHAHSGGIGSTQRGHAGRRPPEARARCTGCTPRGCGRR